MIPRRARYHIGNADMERGGGLVQAYIWEFNICFRMEGLHTTEQMSVEMQMTVEKQAQPAGRGG